MTEHDAEVSPPPTADQRLAELERNMATWGIIEIAARNPSVSEYMAHWEGRTTSAEAENEAQSADIERLKAAIKRQSGAAATLRQLTLDEVQHLKDKDRSEYKAAKTVDSERDANAFLTAENEAQSAEIARLREALAEIANCADISEADAVARVALISKEPTNDPAR